jgi:hypothetical protein
VKTKDLLLVAGGVVLGYVLAIAKMKNVYAKMLDEEVALGVEAEVSRVKETFEDEKAQTEEEAAAEIESIKNSLDDAATALVNYQGYAAKQDIDVAKVLKESPVEEAFPDVESPSAHLISFETYINENDPWRKAAVDYYELDTTLAGDNDNKVTEKWVDILNGVIFTAIESNQVDRDFYVRIPDENIDVEVHRINDSYAAVVLGEVG